MKRHPLDPFSLVFGATFAVLGVLFLLSRADFTASEWVWPLPLIALGGLIIVLAARPSGSPREDPVDRSPEDSP